MPGVGWVLEPTVAAGALSGRGFLLRRPICQRIAMRAGLNALSGHVAWVPQRETQHVKVLYPVLEDWFGIVLDEEVMLDARHPKTMPLVEGKLMAKRASAYLHPSCASVSKEVNDPPQ